MQPKPPRPTGVTILAILAILGGIGGLLVGGVLLAAAAIVGTLDLSATYPQLASYNLTSATIGVLLGIFGAVILILGLLYLVMGIGFLGGKGWAWTLGMIVAVLSLIIDIPSAIFFGPTNVLGIIIAIIILYYLTRTRVKAFFGKAAWGPPAMGGPSMMSASTMGTAAPPTMGTTIKCPACGAMAPAGSTKCPSCGSML
jgi:hypothetical protein